MTQTNFLNPDVMEVSIVSARGQVVIPKKIRAVFQIKPGTRMRFEARGGEIVLTPLTPRYFGSDDSGTAPLWGAESPVTVKP